MKNMLSYLCCILIVSSTAFAQSSYNFKYQVEPYYNLANAIDLNQGLVWDNPNYSIHLPFEFTLLDKKINSLKLNANKGAVLNNHNLDIEIDLFTVDICDGSLNSTTDNVNDDGGVSVISYKVDDRVDGEHSLVIEWKKVALNRDVDRGYYLNFQVWFYEKDQKIEFRFGPTNIPNDEMAMIQLIPGILQTSAVNKQDKKGYLLGNTANNPELYYYHSDLHPGIKRFVGIPKPGTVYTFSPKSADASMERNLADANQLIVRQNISENEIYIDNKSNKTVSYQIIDLQGKVVLKGESSNARILINLAQLNNGMYILNSQQDSKTKNKRILKL